MQTTTTTGGGIKEKEEEARESRECNVFDKVNGLRVALCFGGCRVLGCIIVVVFMAGNITPQSHRLSSTIPHLIQTTKMKQVGGMYT
eukprot:scaffold13084_cov77-Skeletonema_dohrnii-CCMP3373.AAC.2